MATVQDSVEAIGVIQAAQLLLEELRADQYESERAALLEAALLRYIEYNNADR